MDPKDAILAWITLAYGNVQVMSDADGVVKIEATSTLLSDKIRAIGAPTTDDLKWTTEHTKDAARFLREWAEALEQYP